MIVSLHHHSRSSSRRSLRTARNRCTRTVASLRPSAWLTSFVLCSAIWQSVNTVRCRSGQLLDGGGNLARPFARDEPLLRARVRRHGSVGHRVRRRRHRQRPSQPAGPRLPQVQASIHQDPREPHLEGQVLPVCRDVREHLDEGVLHRLIGVVRVPEIVIGDAHGAPLLQPHQVREPLPGHIALAGHDERLYLGRHLRVLRQRKLLRRTFAGSADARAGEAF